MGKLYLQTEMMDLSHLLTTILSGGAIAVGIGYVSSQLLRGRNDRRKGDIDTENTLITYLKNQIDGFKEITTVQNKKIEEMGNKFAALEAVCAEKDKTIERYLAILQNRNPEMDTFMRNVSAAVVAQADFHKEYSERSVAQTQIFGEIRDFMSNLNASMQQLDKEFKIEATVKH